MKTIHEVVNSEHKTIIDVRSPQEFSSDHIPGAINIPVQEIGERSEEIATMQKPVVVYCLSGGRSSIAAGILQQAGIAEVYNGGSIGNMQLLLM